MIRYDLTDFEWRVIEPLLPNKLRGVPGLDRAICPRNCPTNLSHADQISAPIYLKILDFLVLAGAAGFEPANAGTKNRCLTTWRRPSRTAAYNRACRERKP